ncbi:type II toxin-antitoxin system CcdA family antitoxin [Parasphingorhabdus flavimaris]|uniref:type II toxin-antitoxin system CcdA family antitoxin n=1 Tax=Parasphingorhabdus flavimaris TaxID=266812 RepID=UPI003AB95623
MRILYAHRCPEEFPTPSTARQQKPKRRPVNLSIREDILSEAKALQLNASKAAEAAIVAAINLAWIPGTNRLRFGYI